MLDDDGSVADPNLDNGGEAANAVDPPAPAGIAVARARRAKTVRRLEENIDVLLDATVPSLQRAVSSKIFANGSQKVGKHKFQSRSSVFNPAVSVCTSIARQHKRLKQRGFHSYMKRVRQQLPDFLADCDIVVGTELVDDASMWCKKVANASDIRIAKAKVAKSKKFKGKKKGRMCR